MDMEAESGCRHICLAAAAEYRRLYLLMAGAIKMPVFSIWDYMNRIHLGVDAMASWKNKIKSINPTFLYTICCIFQQGISFITVPIFTRILSTEDYGLTSIYSTWFALIVIFATLNLQYGAFNTAMIKFEEDRERYISSMQGLATTITAVIFVIYFCFRDYVNDAVNLSTGLIIAMFLQVLFRPAFDFWSGKKRFQYRYGALVILTMSTTIVIVAVSIIAVLCARDNRGAVRIYTMVLIECVVYGGLYVYNLIKGRHFFVKEYWKFALGFNIPLVPYYLSQQIFNQSDRIMIDYFCGRSEAGIYGVAYTLSMIFTIVINAANNSFVPWEYEKMKKGDCRQIGKVINGIALLILSMLVLLILCAPEIILIFASRNYYEARWIVPPVAASVFFLFLSQLFINIEFYFEEKKMLVEGSLISALVNVALNSVCIPSFGFTAAGYTTLFSYILFALCNYFGVRKVLKKHWQGVSLSDIYDMKALTGMAAGFLGVMAVLVGMYEYRIGRYLLLAVIVLLLCFRRKDIWKLAGLFRK